MRFLFLILQALCFLRCQSQPPDARVEYREGKKAFVKAVFNFLCNRINGCYTENDSLRMGNKYFILFINMDVDGKFLDSISALSIQDTTNTAKIVAAVRQTEGHWINHTGKSKKVILPLYFIFERSDDKRPVEKNPVLSNFFYSTGQGDVICLEPFIITLWQGVS